MQLLAPHNQRVVDADLAELVLDDRKLLPVGAGLGEDANHVQARNQVVGQLLLVSLLLLSW